MKTTEDLNKLINEEISAIEALRSEDTKIWSNRGGAGVDAKRSKKIMHLIGGHNDEIVRLRRLIHFVEATQEEGVSMMLNQLKKQVEQITASSEHYKLKEQKKEYLAKAGMPLKQAQIKELEFILK